MQHSHTMRQSAKAFAAFVTLATVGACADSSSVAPMAEVQAITAPANYVRVGNSIVFRVNNAQGITKKLGSHVINIPRNAICDMTTAGYGPTMWDAPCTPLRGSVTITATVFANPHGQPYIDFQPALRFNPEEEVTLFFRQGQANAPVSLSIQYCTVLGCVDESIADPSLRPFRIGKTPVLGRRLKHFSGYAIIAGDECEYPGVVTTDENGNLWCDMGEGGLTRKSGYMVASGEDIKTTMGLDDKKKDDEK